MENTKSNLSLENRQSLSVTGITKVKTTEPTQVVAHLNNSMIVITGQNLSIENLSVKEGLLDLTGLVNSIKYTNSQTRKFSFKNMFK